MKKTIYDVPPAYGWQHESAEAAERWLEEWRERIDHVIDYWMSHGAPRPKIQTRVGGGGPGGAPYWLTRAVFAAGGLEVEAVGLALAIRAPYVTLAELADRLPGVEYAPWSEPVPPVVLPTGRPFDFERPDELNPDAEAYLSNRNDHYDLGATWIEGGRVYVKERRARAFFGWIGYTRWRLAASADTLGGVA